MAEPNDQLEQAGLLRDMVLKQVYDLTISARTIVMADGPANEHILGEVVQEPALMHCPLSMHRHHQFRLRQIVDDTDKLSKHHRAGSSPPACSDTHNLEVVAQRVQHAPNHAPRRVEGSDGEAKPLCVEF